jgi:hypothetical protein
MPYYPPTGGGSGPGPATGNRFIQCTLAKQGPNDTWIIPQGQGIIQDPEITDVSANSQFIELTTSNTKDFGILRVSFLELAGYTGLIGTVTPTGIGGAVQIILRRFNGTSYEVIDPTTVAPTTYIQFGMWIAQ